MVPKRRVLCSINDEGAQRCVDLFVRPDGTTGFEEFRRDPEDPRGWSAIGGHSERIFPDEASTRRAALASVPWLPKVIGE